MSAGCAGDGLLLEQPAVRLRVRRRFRHLGQQGPSALHADPEPVPQ